MFKFQYFANAVDGWWLVVDAGTISQHKDTLISKFGEDWVRHLNVDHRTACVNRSGGYHYLTPNHEVISTRLADTWYWPEFDPTSKSFKFLEDGPLRGHYMIDGEYVVCAKCGKDLTGTIRTLGNRDMVMAHHAYSDAVRRSDDVMTNFQVALTKVEDPQVRNDVYLLFCSFVSSVNETTNAVVASHGMLSHQFDPTR